jgi:hypothetical protein
MMKNYSQRSFLAAVLPAAMLLMAALPVCAQSFVAPPESLPGGLSYEQWSAKWWQWVWSIPYAVNPLVNPQSFDCSTNQSGPVWFLASTAGRPCVIPAGKMIFLSIVSVGEDYPCPATFNFNPGPGQSLEQFLTIGYGPNWGARQFADHETKLVVRLDRQEVEGLYLPPVSSKYRVTSPLFAFTGDPSLSGPQFDPCVTGSPQPGLTDGYFIMLAPLSPGQHTLYSLGEQVFHEPQTFHQKSPPGRFTVEVTYNLTII